LIFRSGLIDIITQITALYGLYQLKGIAAISTP